MATDRNKDKLLVVLGATGTQGGAVLRFFANQPNHLGFRLRGISRNVASEASRSLQAIEVAMVETDLGNLESLQRAFSEATHIFANTDSNQLIFEAVKRPELLGEGQIPRTYAQEIEERYGSNIASAAASVPTLQRIVWSSLPSPKKWSNGRYLKVTMFDAKQTIADMLQSKPELCDKISTLMIGFYADNALRVPEFCAPQKQSDGVYELAWSMSGDVPVPIADVERDVGRWISALFQVSPGVVLIGSSELMSWKEWLTLWGHRNHVETRYRETSPEEFSKKVPGLGDALLEELKFVEEYGFTGGQSDTILPDQLGALGAPVDTTGISDHIERCDWSKIL
ncbi:MAG: hypothetical protein M1820_003224 [Bogoriella megaspora]|nr:MAG: hypothetical protein M1820_003224 [Bogoriella megaspora]